MIAKREREPKPTIINGVVIHPHITQERVVDAVHRQMETLDNPGFCIACGEEDIECEPDAVCYECDYCGEKAVYGAAELLIYMVP